MNRQQNIYNKLAKFSKIQEKPKTALSKCKYNFSKKQVRLKKRNVKLSLIDDITERYDNLSQLQSIASYYLNERFDELEDKWYDFQMEIGTEVDNMAVNTSVGMINEESDNLSELLLKIQDTANDLGMTPEDLYSNYNEVYQTMTISQTLYDDFLSKYKDFARLAGLQEFL